MHIQFNGVGPDLVLHGRIDKTPFAFDLTTMSLAEGPEQACEHARRFADEYLADKLAYVVELLNDQCRASGDRIKVNPAERDLKVGQLDEPTREAIAERLSSAHASKSTVRRVMAARVADVERMLTIDYDEDVAYYSVDASCGAPALVPPGRDVDDEGIGFCRRALAQGADLAVVSFATAAERDAHVMLREPMRSAITAVEARSLEPFAGQPHRLEVSPELAVAAERRVMAGCARSTLPEGDQADAHVRIDRALVEGVSSDSPVYELRDLRGQCKPGSSMLAGASAVGACLSGAALSSCDLGGAVLIGADLAEADLSGCSLSSACALGADLDGADLSLSDLSSCDLRGATMRGVDLTMANLASCDLRGADLTGASMDGCYGLATTLVDERTILPEGASSLLAEKQAQRSVQVVRLAHRSPRREEGVMRPASQPSRNITIPAPRAGRAVG